MTRRVVTSAAPCVNGRARQLPVGEAGTPFWVSTNEKEVLNAELPVLPGLGHEVLVRVGSIPIMSRGWAAVAGGVAGVLRRRVLGTSLGVLTLLAACTLTRDDFAPLEVSVGSSNGQAGSTDAGSQPVSSPGSECEVSADCSVDRACVSGACVARACADAEDISACEIAACLAGSCTLGACSDGEQGTAETDVDCGGSCTGCALDAKCVGQSDCREGECVGGRCAVPTCSDGVQDQDESAADCGGSCPACAAGRGCGSDADCADGSFCSGDSGVCSPISCQDGVLNGKELSTDCGGGVCPGCAVGSACELGSDCSSGACGADSRCVAPSCADSVRNQDETDVDCGGSCPRACEPGGACAGVADCASGVCGSVNCAAGLAQCCQAPSCGDGLANGTEPVTDCGNAQCGPCATGHACTSDAQCLTRSCGPAGTCQVPLVCGDGMRDASEGDIDCGGVEAGCPRCGDGRTCSVGADCASRTCAGGRCVSCGDGIQNGDEAGVDCGGAASACAACPRCNEFNSIDLGRPGTVSTLPANSCAKLTLFPSYSPSLFESFGIGPFPFGFSWRQACSGQQGASNFNQAYEQREMTGLSTACPVVIELQGSGAAAEVRWY